MAVTNEEIRKEFPTLKPFFAHCVAMKRWSEYKVKKDEVIEQKMKQVEENNKMR